jgi:GTPase SAR1 family protein
MAKKAIKVCITQLIIIQIEKNFRLFLSILDGLAKNNSRYTVPLSIMDHFLYANRRVELALWDTAGQEDFDKVSFSKNNKRILANHKEVRMDSRMKYP